MLYGSVALFVLTALIGIYMITFLFRDKDIPKGLAFIHGPLAVTALVLLIVYAFREEKQDDHAVSIFLFVAAAVGGLVMITRDLLRKPVPKWLAIAHALLAVAGLVLILVREDLLG